MIYFCINLLNINMFYFLQSNHVRRWLQANKVASDMKLDNILSAIL